MTNYDHASADASDKKYRRGEPVGEFTDNPQG